MFNLLQKKKYFILLWIFIFTYIIYFSYFTILRYKTLYASYFDLGIMHQTVFNTFKGLQTGDFSRILELTNPFGPDQIKRMAIHNDILLALLALFYFIYSGVETLLIIQVVVVALGALAVHKIAQHVFGGAPYSYLLSLIFSLAYLLYPPLQKGNIFDFHAVTLATTTLLFMFYFWLLKKYKLSLVFFILSILSKEQVALTTMMFGLYGFWTALRHSGERSDSRIVVKNNDSGQAGMTKKKLFSLCIIFISIFWFALSIFYIIPVTRGSEHFAIGKYGDFGNSPIGIIIGIVSRPYSILKIFLSNQSLTYYLALLGPLGFLSVLSPLPLLIALPELAINTLSKDPSMRNIYYHYAAVITPYVFISAIYGANKLMRLRRPTKYVGILAMTILFFSILFAYLMGPLPGAKDPNVHPMKYPQAEAKDTAFWARTLKDESLKISTTGQLSPFFTSRRYFYTFSEYYPLADYIIVRLNEIYTYYEKEKLIPLYEKLKEDTNYELIFRKENFEVYKKVIRN